MELIDSHVHVWDPDVLSYEWLVGTDVNRPMLPAAYRREGVAVSGAIFVEAADDLNDPLIEARWVAGLQWPELRAIVARADLAAQPVRVAAQLEALATVPLVVGVRHLLQDLPTRDFHSISDGLRELAARGGTFDACIRHAQLPALMALLRPVPGLTVVLDHVGKPPIDDGIDSTAGSAWAKSLAALAARPGTFVKLSGIAAESRDRDAFERHVDAFLAHALDVFGPDRSMIASDWPVSAKFGVGGLFSEWVDRVRALVPPEAWPMVSAGAAERAYLADDRPRMRPLGS